MSLVNLHSQLRPSMWQNVEHKMPEIKNDLSMQNMYKTTFLTIEHTGRQLNFAPFYIFSYSYEMKKTYVWPADGLGCKIIAIHNFY